MKERPSQQIYWRVGAKKFFNKWDAIRESQRTGAQVDFLMFDDSFEKFDWRIEPAEDFRVILRKRAEQIREEYDYIRLFYSGGVDSHTCLTTFIENKIHLDEILVFRCSVFTEKFDNDPAEAEITHVALPFLRAIQKDIPRTKITVLETTPRMLASILKEDYFYEGSSFAIRPWRERHLYQLHPKLWVPYRNGKKHCDLRGGDKPKLFLNGSKVYVAMWDSSRLWDIGDHFLENFYLTPEMPEVHAKQCHLVKKYLEESGVAKSEFSSFFNVFDTIKTDIINSICRLPRFREVNLGKGITGIKSTKQLLVEEAAKKHNTHIYELWRSFLKNEGCVYTERFNEGNIELDFKGILSRKYYLGDYEPSI